MLSGQDIAPEPVRWIWPGWLARGKLHVLAGTAGTGKTTLALAMAATVTGAGRWPDGSRADRGGVVIWSGEDDPGDTLVPRLIASGADMTRIRFVGAVLDQGGRRSFDPATDVALLAERLQELGDVALLIVDPIVSAVAADSHKNGEVRRSLQPLVDVAGIHGCALLGITHYSKGSSGRDPLERVTGSLAFGALPRVVMGTAKPTEPGAMRRLVRAKSNIGPDGGGFEYDLQQAELSTRPDMFASYVLWGDPIDGTARELLAEVETESEDEEHGTVVEAADFLRTLLAYGPMPAKELKGDADGAGHSWRTIQRAKKKLGVVAAKDGLRGGWFWRLPDSLPKDAKYPEGSQTNYVAPFGNVGALQRPDEPGEVF
jgi:putative DNA primase/helicase